MRVVRKLAMLVVLAPAVVAPGEEPNDDFYGSTYLEPGVLSVSDELGELVFPDTLLGIRGLFGDIVASDDDSSPYGDGLASALYETPTNSGSIDFVVSGYGDDGFYGDHGEAGGYTAEVTVYDPFGDEVDFFVVDGVLEPGFADEYSFNDFNWLNGSYDVEIDNTVGGSADVDFFVFNGLTPGDTFVAETIDTVGSEIDTMLGWFDSDGGLIDSNDDEPSGLLTSLLEGTVPDSGEVVLAVTGYGDDYFYGEHGEFGAYDLALSVFAAGDFNRDSVVDAADYVVWRNEGLPAADLQTWKANYGETRAAGASLPEPASLLLLATAGVALVRRSAAA